MNCNIRNRRQKILHNISFDTEVYDIYSPMFTSDESESESSSSSGSSSLVSEHVSEIASSTLIHSVLKEQDLDYNSENNKSSLSSIHKNLVFQDSPSKDIGGCEIEDMQDDTVMNRCNYMLKAPQGDQFREGILK
jgi:hypothetical protein